MLIPESGFPVREYDVAFLITPTSRFGHASDTVLSITEMQVENTTGQEIRFPFHILTTDPGIGAESAPSLDPRVLNGSREVEISDDEIDEERLAALMVERARAGGVTDEADLERVRAWARSVLGRAERTKRGRTRIGPGETRRIVVQQRIRVRPDENGIYVLETIAPIPAATLIARGRVSVTALLPFEDDDTRLEILEGEGQTTREYAYEKGRAKGRLWAAWHWTFDPVFKLVYRYL
jgi:hypothetical protein